MNARKPVAGFRKPVSGVPKKKDRAPKAPSIRVIELVPGFFVSAYKSPIDGGLVVEFEGAPPDDEDCERVRVYMNEGFAAEWIGIGDPRYGEHAGPTRVPGCTCASGKRGESCTLDCKAKSWR